MLARSAKELGDPSGAGLAAVKARLITLVIQSQPGDLEAISDEAYTVPSLRVSEDAVGRVLSV